MSEPKENNITRENTIAITSLVGIFSNFLLAFAKVLVGIASNSIAIISDSIHGLVDALSSFIIFVSAKISLHISKKHCKKDHTKIEKVAEIIVSLMVLTAGITTLVESIKSIIEPEEVEYDVATMIVLVMSIVVKLCLGLYTRKKGKETKSEALIASSVETLNDSIISVSVLASAIIYLLFKVDLSAYVGIIISLVILKHGLELNCFRPDHVVKALKGLKRHKLS